MYFNLKLKKDSNDGIKSKIKWELNCEIKEEFNFIITDKSKDKLIIEYKNEADKNKIICKCILILKDYRKGITEEGNILMEPCGLIHLYIKLDKKYQNIEKKQLEEEENYNIIRRGNKEKKENLFEEKKENDNKNIEDYLKFIETKNSKIIENNDDKIKIKDDDKELIDDNNNIVIIKKDEKYENDEKEEKIENGEKLIKIEKEEKLDKVEKKKKKK